MFPRLWALAFISLFAILASLWLQLETWVVLFVCFLALAPWFVVVRTYYALGGVCKRSGRWQLGAILLKANLSDSRRRALAAHEVFYSAIDLNIVQPRLHHQNMVRRPSLQLSRFFAKLRLKVIL